MPTGPLKLSSSGWLICFQQDLWAHPLHTGRSAKTEVHRSKPCTRQSARWEAGRPPHQEEQRERRREVFQLLISLHGHQSQRPQSGGQGGHPQLLPSGQPECASLSICDMGDRKDEDAHGLLWRRGRAWCSGARPSCLWHMSLVPPAHIHRAVLKRTNVVP